MTARAPPPAPDWPASCGAGGRSRARGRGRGTRHWLSPSLPSSAPPRQTRKPGEPILAPGEPGSRRRTEHAQQGPAREENAGTLQARAAAALMPREPGWRVALCRTGQRTAAPVVGRPGAAREAGGERRQGSGEPPAPRWADGGRGDGSSPGAHFALVFSKWRGQNAKKGKSQPRVQGTIHTVTPREGARANSSPESVKQTTSPALQLEAFAGRSTGKKGREGGERKVGTGYLNLNQNRKEN